MTEPVDGASDTRDRLIEMTDGAPPVYFSRQVGRDHGCPLGGWSTERAKATRFTEDEAKSLLEAGGSLAHMAQRAKVVLR